MYHCEVESSAVGSGVVVVVVQRTSQITACLGIPISFPINILLLNLEYVSIG